MSEEEKKAIRDCDIIFINLDDMMSEESANDYRASYRIIKKLINNLQKEIEEKTTIIMAGAEKVKELEKEIEELKEKIADLETKLAVETIDNKYNQEERDEETIPRYKIREKIEEIESFDNAMHQKNGQFTILVLQGLLKENIKEKNS